MKASSGLIFLSMLMGALISLPSLSAAREGHVSSILYNCNLNFSAKGQSVAIGIGFTRIHGTGQIRCYDLLTGVTETIPVRVQGRGPSLGLKVAGFNISGGATGLGLSSGPRSLLGSYAGVRGSVAVVKGVGATLAIRLARSNLTINVAVNAESGIGAGLDALVLDLREDLTQQPTREEETVNSDYGHRHDHLCGHHVGAQYLTIRPGQEFLVKGADGRVLYVIRGRD